MDANTPPQDDDVRLIKRYSNRKLYDVHEKRYITLQEIKQLMAEGHSVKVIDRDSGEDISRITLAKILLELESEQKGSLPLGILRGLVTKSQESVVDYVRRSVQATKDAINQLESSTQEQIDKIVERGQMTEKEAKAFVAEIVETAKKGRNNLEQMLEQQYQHTLTNLRIAPKSENEDLHARVARLEATIERLTTVIERHGIASHEELNPPPPNGAEPPSEEEPAQ